MLDLKIELQRIWRKLAVIEIEYKSANNRIGYGVHQLRQNRTRIADVTDSDRQKAGSLSDSVGVLHEDCHVQIKFGKGNYIY